MMSVPLKRKLAAILAADAVGYSRLMSADEEGTMKLLAAHRAVIDGIIAFHEGRIVNTAGDSVLAEFASPVQAVRCAVEIQDALRTRNDSLPAEHRLQFRIGVNLGDVMVKGEDLLGDGVNVAARLESVAEPGGICVSSSVYDQIAGKLDLGFVDIGAKALKNIDRPVRIYRIERAGRSGSGRGVRSSRRAVIGRSIAAAVLLAALGVGAWHLGLLPMPKGEDSEAAKAAAERMEMEQELARARAQARAEKERAEAQAAEAAKARRALEEQRAAEARARAEAELARARADAEATRRKAAAELEAAAAKRRLEEQRAAEARTRVDTEIARKQAEVDEARRRVAAELAAAEEARHSAEASASAPAGMPANIAMAKAPASLRDGGWSVEISCPQFGSFPPRTITMPLARDGEAFVAEKGAAEAPLSLSLRGVQDADGSLWLRGKGVSGLRAGARTYPAGFFVKPVDNRYEGQGRLGKRECTAIISRAP